MIGKRPPRSYLGGLFFCGGNRILAPESFESFSSCGENRIRTCEPVLPATRFPDVSLSCSNP